MDYDRNNRIIVKTLVSDIYTQKHEFNSIFDCKKKRKVKNPFIKSTKDVKRIETGPYGPLIVIHRERPEKILPKEKKRKTFFEKIPKYTFFHRHANCSETKGYWEDPKTPKILRHYTPPKTKKGIKEF